MASPKNTSTLTTTEVRDLLRTAAAGLSAREEKALRMRHGGKVSMTTPLPRRGQTNPEARAELFAMELELLRKFGAPVKAKAVKKEAPKTATRVKEKEKIIRALRRLK